MSKPREYTREEVREHLLRHIWHLIDEWENESRKPTCREKLQGLAFSILSTLDGCSAALPGFIVAPCPNPADKVYHQEQGDNYYPENHEAEIKADVGGSLHEFFYQVKEGK